MQVLKLGNAGDLSGIIEFPAFWGHYALSRWTLFRGEDSPPPVPDRGATEMLLATAFGVLVMAWRILKS